jgi:hypothetical protein
VLTCTLAVLSSMSGNAIRDQGMVALAEALKVNRTVTTME